MKQYSMWFVIALVTATVGFISARAHAETYGDVQVNEMALPRPEAHISGYLEYRYSLYNSSKDKTHSITLELPGTSWGASGKITRTITLPPMTEGKISLWQPKVLMEGDGATVYIDGRRQKDYIPTDLVGTNYSGYYGSVPYDVLFSQGVDGRFRDQLSELEQKATAASSSYASADEFGQRTTVPVQQWSVSWLGYTSFTCLVMTQEEWRILAAPVKNAICDYVEIGGSLLIVGQFIVPARWQERMGEWKSQNLLGMRTSPMGLGLIADLEADRMLEWNELQHRTAKSVLWDANVLHRADTLDISTANSAFPIADSLTTPVRGMFVIMLIYAILIGPVNMYVCARLNKRLWTLVVIPVAAIIFSAGVFLYTVFSDGISAYGRTRTLTMLDQRNQKAVSLGWLAYYAPLQPWGGFHFDTDTELTPQLSNSSGSHYYSAEDNSPRHTDWSTDQHLVSGWISSRIPCHITLRKVQSRRERLEITRESPDSIIVTNGLGSDLTALLVADEQGNLYEADGKIQAGEKIRLERLSRKIDQPLDTTRLSRDIDLWRSSPDALNITEKTLVPGSYLATMQDAVFTEQGLANLKTWKAESIVYGLYTFSSTTFTSSSE